MKLSVIIPVFQSEDTLDRCLRSVVNQTYGNLDIIIVNDGSTDASLSICQKWAAHDGRISIIDKKNGGLSDARNRGIEKASGRYVTFVDSDDELKHETFAELMNMLFCHPDYDILEYPICRHYGTLHEQSISFGNKEYNGDIWSEYWLTDQGYTHTYACNKIFRLSLVNDMKFEYRRKFEDIFFMSALLRKNPRIATTTKGLYLYHDNPRSITATATGLDLRDMLEAHLRTIKTLAAYDTDEYYMHILNIQLDVHRHCGQMLLKRRFVHPLRLQGTANRLKAALLPILGMHGLCWLHSAFVHTFRR